MTLKSYCVIFVAASVAVVAATTTVHTAGRGSHAIVAAQPKYNLQAAKLQGAWLLQEHSTRYQNVCP